MKMLELHILQSHAVFCGNRDDVGRPKTAIFGGEKRARISSQCLKRATRLHLSRADSPYREYFQGIRTKQLVGQLVERLKQDASPTEAEMRLAQAGAHVIAGLDFDKEEGDRVTTSMFFSAAQFDAMSKALKEFEPNRKKQAAESMGKAVELEDKFRRLRLAKQKPPENERRQADDLKQAVINQLTKPLLKALVVDRAPVPVADAADIALFGRVVASHPELTVEAAGMFSHALSTHRADPEQDFYTAVDDRQPEEDTGADMMGNLEYISATYYRYVALNLDLLFYRKGGNGGRTANLAHYAGDEFAQARKNIVQAFIEAAMQAVPSGRKTSMASPTSVDFAVGVVRPGQPIQLVNAFEAPVQAGNCSGFLKPSVARLEDYRLKMYKAWGIQAGAEDLACFYPDAPTDFTSPKPLDFLGFVRALVAHVD